MFESAAAAPFEPREVVLADGGSAQIRPAMPQDEERLLAFHQALSLDTIHFRYFSAVAKLPRRLLDRFTRVDFARDMVLIAELGEQVIALASYHGGPEPGEAEVAFVVADQHQHRGLGTLLLEQLAELARERGIVRFRADTLSHNRNMLRVFGDAGYELERVGDLGIVHVRFPVGDTPLARPARERREHLAEARSVAPILAPRSLWLTGELAADAERIRALGFKGEIATDAARPPPGVDLVSFAGPADELPGLVASCAAAHAHALLLGALHGEPSGAELERFDRELRVAVRRNGMRLVGPSSGGVANTAPSVSLVATALEARPAAGPLALVCDASHDGADLVAALRVARLGVSELISLGRRADVSVNDLLQYWQDDPQTRTIGLAVDGVGNEAKFQRIARQITPEKRLFALATGRSATDSALAAAGVELARSLDAWVARARALA